jgi:tripartite-type tricarboxylate transporter receptor subunit TctC
MKCVVACAFVAAAALATSVTGLAQQDAYPAKPVRLVVPFPTGGSADILGRTVAERLSAQWSQQVLVDNRSGAAGIVGTDAVAKAAPDGYTIGLVPDPLFTSYPALYPKLPYDPRADFAPIVLAASLAMGVFAHPSVSANSLAELIAAAKAKPGTFAFGTPGNGTPMHLGGELINQSAGVQLVHIPYRGGGPATADLLGGQIPLAIVGIGSAAQHVRAGKLKAIAALDSKRSPAMPEMPTIAESGIPGYEVTTWFALYAPAKTPPAVIARLHGESVKALAHPEARQRLERAGMDTVGAAPEQVSARLERDRRQWEKVIRAASIKLDQ